MAALRPAPEWTIAHWLNAPAPLTLESLRGRVVMMVAFQMLCPGCVSLSLPQAGRVRAAFADKDVAVIGLHTVFEHVEAQGSPEALGAFLHEYRIALPVGIDRQARGGGAPQTMRAYAMQGTPTTLLIDRGGYLRLQKFGHLEDMVLGAAIAKLVGEGAPVPSADPLADKLGCDDEGCRGS